MRKLREVYADSDIIIRTKTPQLRTVLILGSALLPLVIASDTIVRDYVAAAMETVILVSLLTSLTLLFRGRYRLSSLIALTMVTVAIIMITIFIEPDSRRQVQSVALYMVVPVVVSLTVTDSEWYTFAMVPIGLAIILGVSFLKIAPALPALGDTVPIMGEVVVGAVVFVLISTFAGLIARSTFLYIWESP